MKLQKLAGATSEIWQIFIRDSSSTTGAGLTGLTNASGSLTAYYHRDTDTTATAISLVTMTVGTFTSSGFKEIDATNMPGWYQFCPPNAALASGAKSVGFHLKGAANMAPLPIEVQLLAINVDDAVRMGMTALPNAAAEAAGGLYTRGTGAGQINQDANGRVDANVKTWIGGTIPAVNVTGVPIVDDKYLLGTIYATPSTAGIQDINVLNWKNAAAAAMTGDAYARLGAPAGASVSADIAAAKVDTAAIKVQTDKVTFTIANQVDVNVLDWKSATAPAMTGDAFARIGVAGDGLTALGDTRIAHLDADISSRMATYTQPTGFLAATFPGTVASTTNITGGTITTVTNLTNAATSGDLTAAMIASVTTAATAATPTAAAVTGSVGSVATGGISAASFAAGAIDNAAIATDAIGSAELAASAVTEIQSGLSTYAGGDTSGTTTLLSRLTNTRAELLDHLDADISSRLASGSYTVPLDAAGVRSAVGLASANLDTQLDALPTNGELATALGTADDAVLAQVALVKANTDLIPGTQDGKTFAETTLLMASALLGKASGMATTTAVFRAVDDSKDRITATVDASGNRTAVTLDAG